MLNSKVFSFLAMLSIFMCSTQVFASQQDVLDQLDKIESITNTGLKQIDALLSSASDKTKIKIQLKLAKLYRQGGEMAKAENILNNLLASTDSLEDEDKVLVWRGSAGLERSKNNYQIAADILKQKVLPLVTEGTLEFAEINHQLGRYLRLQYKLADAKKHYQIAEIIYQREQNIHKLADIYGSLGVLYESQADYSSALNYQQRALEIFKEHGGDKASMASNYFNLGEIYYRTADYPLALEYFNKALVLDTELNNINDIAFDYHRLASINYELQKFAQALKFNQSAIALLTKQQANQALSRSYLQEAQIYHALGREQLRGNSLQLAQQANTKAPTNLQQSRIWADFATYYRDKKDYLTALSFAQQAEELGRTLETDRYTLRDNKLLSELYYQTGAFEKAYLHMTRAFDSKTQIADEQKIKESAKFKRDITLLEEQLKVGKLEKESAQQSELIAKAKLQQQLWILVFIVLTVVLIAIKYILWQKQKMANGKAAFYADVVDEKNQLLADLSHELRTPLSALKLHAEALQHDMVSDVSTSYLAINKKVDDVNGVITDIYQLAQFDMGALELNIGQCNISNLLLEITNQYREKMADQNIRFSCKLSHENLLAHCDKARMKQVIENILQNSLEYTDKPGVVLMAAKVKSNQLEITIDDSSPGVPDDELDKIFRRLYRIDPSRSRQTGGSGLGLAICQSFVEAQKGSIKAENSDLGGLRIRISLPF